MDPILGQLNRYTAEVVANGIVDRPPNDLSIIDLTVVGKRGAGVINIAYELRGEKHQRVLRSVNDVLWFIPDPVQFTCNTSPEVETWEPELM